LNYYYIKLRLYRETMEEYSTLSRSLTNEISKTDKKAHGIYFTPPSCVNHNLKLLERYVLEGGGGGGEKKDINILEPSCGSGEYITALHKLFPNANITAIENNIKIYQSVKHLDLDNERVSIYNMDYLEYQTNVKYDFIVGNPPYFVMKKNSIDKKYYLYFDGRPNMFILFLVKSFGLLKDDGIISFILPKGFLNCLYYDKTRKYIDSHFKILHIIDCKEDKYIETQQDTILLIIKKTDKKANLNSNNTFILYKHDYTIFTDEITHASFETLYKNSKSLLELGFKASVGNVVWNQCKEILTDDDTKTRLIYSSDIVENSLSIKKYANPDKKNFIDKQGSTNPIIVINRGYGVGEYNFSYCLIGEQKNYLVENHLICIESKTSLPRDGLISALKKILDSLKDERTAVFIKRYFGNNAINITELNHILPIYQDI
jgi:tRNA1(Val) A37 N6-methylase TrmN6